ncbi:MAG: hypothetical protein ACE5FK_02830, partial [Candidatus Methylomirabilia bacterium]
MAERTCSDRTTPRAAGTSPRDWNVVPLDTRDTPLVAFPTMKLLFFHLMPYTDLPERFTREHDSVWVDIDSRLFDPLKAHRMYNEFMDELEFAAEVGLDGICVNEHHSNGYGLMPSPNLIAASLARRTRKGAVVVMGSSLA